MESPGQHRGVRGTCLLDREKDNAFASSSASEPVPQRRYLWSESSLRNGIEDWTAITPEPLQAAVKALRKDFSEHSRKVEEVMTKVCRPALRRGSRSKVESFDLQTGHQPELGSTVDHGFTECEVFTFYFWFCARFLTEGIKTTFSELLEIAFAQRSLIDLEPIKWAEMQSKVLIADESFRISMWLKWTCSEGSWLPSDLEWHNWRAPKWIYMKPFANSPYDRATAWEEVSEADSRRILDVVEDRFNLYLVIGVNDAIDEAHIKLAKTPTQVPEKPGASAEASNDGGSACKQPSGKLSDTARRGKEYLQVREELKKIKHLAQVCRQSTSEIRRENPDFLAWKFAESLSPDDREVFEHPRRWESGYPVRVFLAKCYDKSPATMKKWVAAYRQESAIPS
jgi:hypothetical protein